MKIALFGGSGRVGSIMLDQLLEDGHEVIALARTPEKLPTHPKLTVIQGDAKEATEVDRTIQDVDVVMSALGTDKSTTLSMAVPHMIHSMNNYSLTRIVTIGTAGILQSRIDESKLRYEAGDSNRKLTTAAEDHHTAYTALAATDLKWTIVCPTYLPDGEATGNYRTESNWLPLDGKQISTADTAQFAVAELIAQNYLTSRVGIAY